jgi:hypothetical protein
MRISSLDLAAVLAAAVVAGGCGKRSQPDVPEPGAEAARPAPDTVDKDNVFAPLVDDLQKAKGVQDTVDRQAEQLKKQIEAAEGAADDPAQR